MRQLLAVLVLGLAVLLVGLPAPAAEPVSRDQTQQKLAAVKAKIQKLTRRQQQAAAERDHANKVLAAQARALAEAAAALRASKARLAELQQKLADLQEQRAQVQARLEQQQTALAELLGATYKLGMGGDLRMLLGQVGPCPPEAGDDCQQGAHTLARIQRALAYSNYFRADRVDKIRALLQALASKRQLSEAVAAQQLSIAAQRDRQRKNRDALAAERARQEQLLARTEAEIRQRGSRITQLQQQRQALKQLLERLEDVFADIPSKLPTDKPFDQRRGQLPWPLAGKVRELDDGILITTDVGTDVEAVAHGRVAYADWLRGYGMLLIIDHGHGWMSLYGDNESLLRSVGEWVDAGDVIATSGRGSGRPAGLYFGLRHDGEPVQPKPWLRAR